MRKPQFYIPRVDMWNWRLVSANFVKLQLERARLSYSETDDALRWLDVEVKNIEAEIKGKWASASATTMRAFEARLKEVGQERKRINYVRIKLEVVIDTMRAHLNKQEVKQ